MQSQIITCAFCERPIDIASDFWFDLNEDEEDEPFQEGENLVHPDCFVYAMECGDINAGDVLIHTCGNPLCIKPEHLELPI